VLIKRINASLSVSLCVSLLASILAVIGSAQNQTGSVIVTSVVGKVTLYGKSGFTAALKRGDPIWPGNAIETGNGSIVLAISDGSQVTVYPRSRIVLKDFSASASWKDLLEIIVGRVRSKINHYGNRPNPYRVYSPIASIAVRGTDFLVDVDPSTETRVTVFEGLVEVTGLFNPQNSKLVKPGQNVIVRPGGSIGLISIGPDSRLNESNGLRQIDYGAPNELSNSFLRVTSRT